MRAAALLLAAALAPAIDPPASAHVVDVGAGGFTVRISAHIAAPPDKVYATLIAPARWWSPDHTFSGDAGNLSLEAKAGGCWCERLPGGGSVLHLTVVYASPGKVLRLRGPLGPFQGSAVDGALTWALKPAAGGSDVTLTYALGGYNKDGFAQWAKGADEVLAVQMGRLKRLIETNSPDAAAPAAK